MQHPDPHPSFLPHLAQRFQSLVWSCLDSDLTISAVFHAERYFSIDRRNHDSRHLYATALLREGQIHSALCLVNNPTDVRCGGCLELKARCCTALGRHRQAREALEATLQDLSYVPTASTSNNNRPAQAFPGEAALRCRSGVNAMRGNLRDEASHSFRKALALDPYAWEAFEGLCALGSVPEIDELFPPRAPPVKKGPPEDLRGKSVPVATGAGFFTPGTGNSGNLFRAWKPDQAQPQLFLMPPPAESREAVVTDDSYPGPLQQRLQRPIRAQTTNIKRQTHLPRPVPLPAEEGAPVPKKPRSTRRPPDPTRNSKPSKVAVNDTSKKARARPALIFANIFSSASGHRSQPTASSRTGGLGKSNHAAVPPAATRRSTRLLGGPGGKQPPVRAVKQPPVHGKRQPSVKPRSRSTESEIEETTQGDNAHSHSPPSITQSSEISPSPSTWTASQEQAAQDDYDTELAEHYLYNLTRKFASVARSLATYNCQRCLDELQELPYAQQRSAYVLAMAGRAHYEKSDYAAAERAFKAVRGLQPYRLWDMEVYSTLLWHLQRNVELSFLAQELLSINPQSPQAWIAVGNLFSLQSERPQALTCFRRAAQIDPACAYAYTLSGHESIDEDLDKAVNFFQTALCADARHYNAWYGLGTCYLRMSKIRLAEYHYRKAAEIHPTNAVLLGCVGMAVERRGDRDAALRLFHDAVDLDPDNALVRYRRAKILVSMRKYEAAIEDLEYLRSTAPEESNVVFQLAKAYRLVGDEAKSAQTLAVARDISPKSTNKIKKLLDTVKDESIEDRMDEG